MGGRLTGYLKTLVALVVALAALASAGFMAALDTPAPDVPWASAAPDPGWLPKTGLPAMAPPPSVDYAWPAMGAIDGATLLVDAGADFPPELSMLTVRIRGAGAGAEDAAALWEALAAASKVVIRNPRFGEPDCECQVVADVVVDGDSLAARLAGAGAGR